MARVGITNRAEIAKSLADAKRKAYDNAERITRNMASDILRGVVEGTPEDTSVTVGDWQVGINSVPGGLVDSPDPGGAAALKKGEAAIRTSKLGHTINIVNNQPHADGLNAGNAVSKPAGFVERSIDNAKARAK